MFGQSHLWWSSVLLHRWGQRAAVVVGGGGGLGIVTPQAAEKRAEDAASPLFLQAAVRQRN